MAEVKISLPEVGFIALTRVALGAGIGLLLSGRLRRRQRKTAGWVLAAVGGATTIPLVLRMRSRRLRAEREILPAA